MFPLCCNSVLALAALRDFVWYLPAKQAGDIDTGDSVDTESVVNREGLSLKQRQTTLTGGRASSAPWMVSTK